MIGPVAKLLVRSAASETKHVGDLYMMLAKEITSEDKRKFLGLVNGLDSDYL